jgi:hypothetical protein
MVGGAGRYGADNMVFCGPGGIERLQERLRPVHVLAPWTSEGIAAMQGLPTGPMLPRWLDDRRPDWGAPDAVTGIIAGTLPWHDFDEQLEAEYQGDVDQVPMPAWVKDATMPPSPAGTQPLVLAQPELGYVAPAAIEADLRAKLTATGAKPSTVDEVTHAQTGAWLWLAPGAGPLPDALSRRGPGSRVVLLPGPDGIFDPSWALADWVLPGVWPKVLGMLQGPAWRRALG